MSPSTGGLIAAAVAALIVVPAAVSQDAPQYRDAMSDGGSAGDISGVTVQADKSNGQIDFHVSGSSLSSADNLVTFLFIDTDANPLTGSVSAGGADYAVAVETATFGFARWNGASWVDTPYSTVRVCCVGGGSSVTFSVNRSELGNTAQFNFMLSAVNIATRSVDRAPDNGMYNYSFNAGGPDIQGVTLQTTPSSGPRAGKPFVVVPVGVKLPATGAAVSAEPRPDSYKCRGTLAGRRVGAKGFGGCTLRIPKKTRGKKLAVIVDVTYQGATKSVAFTFVVA